MCYVELLFFLVKKYTAAPPITAPTNNQTCQGGARVRVRVRVRAADHGTDQQPNLSGRGEG